MGGWCVVWRNSEGVVMHCAVQSTLGDLGGKACQVTFLNLVEISPLNLIFFHFDFFSQQMGPGKRMDFKCLFQWTLNICIIGR